MTFLGIHILYTKKLDLNQDLLEIEGHIVICDVVSSPPHAFPSGNVHNHSHAMELPLVNYNKLKFT